MFKSVLKSSKKIVSHNVLLFQYSNETSPFVGFMLSRKYGNAVKRNRFKNRCRFLYKNMLRRSSPVSLIIKPLKNNLDFSSLKVAFDDLEMRVKN